jgi:cell division protein FtsB
MKHLALALFVGTSVYLLINLAFGPGGIREMERLSAHKARLEANLTALSELGRSLEGEVRRLRTDPEEIELRARELGYYRENDEVIRFEGWTRTKRSRSPGSAVRPFVARTSQRPAIRSAAISAGLLTLLVSLIGERVRDARRRRSAAADSPDTETETHDRATP